MPTKSAILRLEPGVGKVYWGKIGGKFIKKVVNETGFDKRKHYTIYDSMPEIDTTILIKDLSIEEDLDEVWDDLDEVWDTIDELEKDQFEKQFDD